MILVTGASGTNGSELVKRLSAVGAAVRAMVRRRRGCGILPGVEFVTADFDDLPALRRALEDIRTPLDDCTPGSGRPF